MQRYTKQQQEEPSTPAPKPGPDLSIHNLSMASTKMSRMNVLIVEKLSIIVAEYFESMNKLQSYYQQIEALVGYNRRLVDILGQFEEHEYKLLTRLRRMEEVNLEYMREYCHLKGREFKLPPIPEHVSIFGHFNLGELVFGGKPEPPVLDLDYKDELLEILNNCFLTSQDDLKLKVQARLTEQISDKQRNALLQIRLMIEHYQELMATRPEQRPMFDLLKLRSELRHKVQSFYDQNEQSQIKPDYQNEDRFLGRIINLHARIEQMNPDAIIDYLKEEKLARSSIERDRIEIQHQIQKNYAMLEVRAQHQEDELREVRDKAQQAEKQIIETRRINEQMLVSLQAQHQSRVTQLQAQIDQLKNFIHRKPTLSHISLQTLTIHSATTNQELHQLITQLQSQNQAHQSQVCRLSLELNQLTERLLIAHQHNHQQQADKQIVEELAVRLLQALDYLVQLQVDERVQPRLLGIRAGLEGVVRQYQQEMHWDIRRQAPDFFGELSMRTRVGEQTQRQVLEEQARHRKGYSLDVSNVGLLKQVLARKQQDQHQHQTMIEKPGEFDLAILEIASEKEKDMNMILDYSREEDENEDSNGLRKLLKQTLECLQMEEQKTKGYEIEYQRFVDKIRRKQEEDPTGNSLEKQLVYLLKLTIEQRQTIETQRKEYNQIFREYQSEFKSRLDEELKSLKSRSMNASQP